jgi:hypothetical protein
MGIWNSTLVYVGARTLLAGAMIALLLRRRVGPWYAGGQVVSDLSCAAFLLAYANPDIRDDIGTLVIPLLLFVLYWETMRFLENRQAAALREDRESWLDVIWRVYGTVWAWGFVLPAVLAAGFLIFELVAPNEWPFPNPRAELVCRPRVLQPGTELTLTMRVPHGAELTVFPPNGRGVTLISSGNQGFKQAPRFTLLPDTLPQVFRDSGVYQVAINTEGDVVKMCRIRYN